ncbi:hypothetical protein LPJ57_003483 [Coemansia sp. RSA 486]|nr:hypothetical protein LPJ57_003483 [Coemansia sp. RSA 486]
MEFGEDSDEDIDLDADGILEALMQAIGIRELSELDKAYKTRNDVAQKSETLQAPLSSVAPAPVSALATLGSASAGTSSASAPIAEEDEATMARIMDAMDHELSATPIGKSFIHYGPDADLDAANSGNKGSGPEGMPDVNVDLNLVENIVRSFRAQEGLPGPAGTMLGQFGVHLPPDASDSDSNDNGDSC